MRCVHKFPMNGPVESYDLREPTLRHVGEDPSGFHDTPCLWIERDEGMPTHRVTAMFVGTGHPTPTLGYEFAGTVVLKSAGLVWHVYTKKSSL